MTTDIEQIATELTERMDKWTAQQRMFEGTVLPFHIEPYKLSALLAALKEAQERVDCAESRLEAEVNDFGDKSALRAERDAAITERDEARAQGQEASLAYMEKRKEAANLEHERDALAAERDRALRFRDNALEGVTRAQDEALAYKAERDALAAERDSANADLRKAHEIDCRRVVILTDLQEKASALKSELTAEMLMLWREYAMSDGGTLTPAAQKLGAELLAAFDARAGADLRARCDVLTAALKGAGEALEVYAQRSDDGPYRGGRAAAALAQIKAALGETG